MKTLTITKQKNPRLRSVASGIGALALSALMASAIGGATVLAQSAPEITLTPGEHEGRTTLKGTASETVTDWEYLRSSSDFDCSDAIFEQYAPAVGLNYIFVSSDQGDITYCFRAKNAGGVWGYANHRFDFNPPEVTNAQLNSQPGQSTVTITVNEPVTSRYRITQSTSCSETSTDWSTTRVGLEATVREVRNICFRLTDQSNKVTYYLYDEITSIEPLVKPEVTVSYHSDRDTVEATANKTINSWAHVVSNQDLGECDEVDYASPTGRTDVAQYTPSKHNQHYYFQGTDADQQKACGKVIIMAAITNPDPTTTKPITTPTQSDAPEIDIDASGRQITASHSEPVAQWRYYRSGGAPICTPDVVWDTEQNSDIVKGRQVIGLTDADVGRWVCFRALLLGTTYRGQEVYKPVQITNTWADPTNTQTLNITFEQSPTTLTAIADPAVPSDRFQYLAYSGSRYPNGPNCRSTNPNMTAEYWARYNAKTGNVVHLANAAEGYYYCFRVMDDQGGASYGMYQVGGIREATKTKPTERTETESIRTLEVVIDQTPTTLTATTNIEAPGASWQYLVFSGSRYPNGPNCNSNNSTMDAEYWTRWETGTSNTVTLKDKDEGQFYCFRVVDENGNAALGEHKVTGVEVAEQVEQTEEADQQETDTTTTTSETNQDRSQNTDTVTVTTDTSGNDQPPVVNVDVVNTPPETPAPQVTVNTQAPESQPVPIELTVNMPETSPTQDPEPEQSEQNPPEDDSVTQGLLWGLGGAIATLVILTTILAIINRGSRH